ncbi:MAG: ABC transporter permease [Thermodesulfovibrionales bacterium]|nr:ABC transporter permease [Thermodesulfovibrionales bacterium]
MKHIKALFFSPIEIFINLFTYRHLLYQMVIREIKGRFVGSIGGLLWNFAHPILMVVIFLFVFVYVFKLRLGDGGASLSVIYIMSGLFPWIIMSEGLSRGTSSLIENAVIIQKTSFPTEILPAKAVIAPLLSHGTALVILAFYVMIKTEDIQLNFLLLPLVVLLQLVLTFGIALVSSTISVFFRDIIQVISLITTFGIYLTPILYPISLLPDWAQRLMYINPFFPFAMIYQMLYTGTTSISWLIILLSIFWTFFFYVIGAFLFNKLKYEFADWL